LGIIGKYDALNIVTPEMAATGLLEFIRVHFGDEHPTAAGKNFASFDRQFLMRLPGMPDKVFKHRTIDPAVLYWHPDEDHELPNTATCMFRAGLDPIVKHRALADARSVVDLVRRGVGRRVTNDALEYVKRVEPD